MESKVCTKCKRTLPVPMFSAAKKGVYGTRSVCKECSARYIREYREKNLQRIQDYENARHRVRKKRKKPFRKEHVVVNKAVRSSEIIKPLFCTRCWNVGVLHGHHTDYARALDVIWLCPKCHGMEHGKRKIEAFCAA